MASQTRPDQKQYERGNTMSALAAATSLSATEIHTNENKIKPSLCRTRYGNNIKVQSE